MKQVIEQHSLKGMAASPGIIIGRAVVLQKDKLDIKPVPVSSTEVQKEINEFNQAIARVKKDLLNMSAAVSKRLGSDYARIFETQAMIADDPVINAKVVELIEKENLQGAYLYYQQIDEVVKQLSRSSDRYLKERILDINSVCNRLIRVLQGAKKSVVQETKGPTVVIAKYLSPADLLGFSVRKTVGFALELGGVTSHTSLLAKSLNLPAIVGIGSDLNKINTGNRVIMDGYSGKLIVNPRPDMRQRFRDRRKTLANINLQLDKIKDEPALTRDGHRLKVYNNIELPAETGRILKSGAEGIGLFRTEYLYLADNAIPDFDKQYKAYKSVLSKMSGNPVLIRTFDMGGDKFAVDDVQAVDPNPFLGWRAIRFCLDRPQVFKTQLKALLKASVHGNMGIMLPMISNLDELLEVKDIIGQCRVELAGENIKTRDNIPLGIMIEVPSAVMIAEHLAQEVDFFSIGTNDLIQYTLAVDRTNKMLTHLYQSFHPAVLKMIVKSIAAGHKYDIKVGLCGEMASDPYAIIILAGMGIDELSTSYLSTGMVKQIIRNIDIEKARDMAAKACSLKSSSQVEAYLVKEVNANFPEILPIIDFIKGANNG
ncbi:MAG: phosphoenolpyruvate--protein phosphotransferase [candidate division Zixibacteria bacterium]|nr:phosphoenolpyruvate--protein phosphotransferase [candidate division Zixibacteria bacterium]